MSVIHRVRQVLRLGVSLLLVNSPVLISWYAPVWLNKYSTQIHYYMSPHLTSYPKLDSEVVMDPSFPTDEEIEAHGLAFLQQEINK